MQLVPLTSAGLPADQPLPDPATGRLPWYRNWLVRLVTFVGIFAAMGASLSYTISLLGLDSHNWPYTVLQVIASAVAYYLLCLLEGRRHPIEMRLSRFGTVLPGLAIGAVGMLVVFVLAVALGAREIRGFDPHYSPWDIALAVGVGAGFAEEVLFRGVLYRLVEGWAGTWGSLAVSALVFGGVHLGNPRATWWGAVAIALEAGIAFGLLYALTRSLWIVMGFHAAWNVVQGPVLGSAISGATLDGEGYIRSYAAGPEILSGGQFGLEASILSVIVWLVFSAWLLRLLLRRNLVVAPFWVRRRRVNPPSA